MTRRAAFNQLRRVREEFDAARFALEVTARHWDIVTVSSRTNGVTINDLRACREQLELTYIIRLFAAFEAMLRQYWRRGVGRNTRPDLEPLLDSVARRRFMDDATRNAVQQLRDFRNKVLHEDARVLSFDLAECARRFGRFVSRLPQEW